MPHLLVRLPFPSSVSARGTFPGALVGACALAVLVLTASSGAAVPTPAGGRSSGSDSSESIDFGDLVEGLGRWFVQAVHDDEPEATVASPRWNAVGSPRQTVMTFLENVDYLRRGHEEAWPRVRATLPPDDVLATRARALDLARVFDRFDEIEVYRLASAEAARGESISRYRVFPGAIDHRPVWNALGDAPDGRIVLALDEGDGTWHFDAATMEGVGALLESVASIAPRLRPPSDAAGLPPLLDTNVLPEHRWDGWILGTTLLAGLLAALLVHQGMKRAAPRLEGRSRLVAAIAMRRLAAPASSLVVLIALVLAGSTVALHPAVSTLRWQVTGLLFVLVLAFFLYRLVPVFGEGLEGASSDSHLSGTAIPLLVRLLQVLLVGITLAIVVESLFSVNVAGLVAGFGILGLALGLAAQESVRNWFGAATIYLARPFTRGDWIIHRGDFARVEEVGLNATKLRLASGELLTVPNMRFIDQEVQNTTERPYLRREMNLSLPYHTDADRMDEVLEVIGEALSDDDVVSEGQFEELGREPHITFHDFGDDHLTVRVYYWYRVEPGESGWYDFLAHCDTVNRAVLRAFEGRGIEFAFPTRTLRLANEDEAIRLHTGSPGRSDGDEDTGTSGEEARREDGSRAAREAEA